MKCIINLLFIGGCKHAVAFLAWLQRRTEEPSPTEVKSYWRQSLLHKSLNQENIPKAIDMGMKRRKHQLVVTDGSCKKMFIEESLKLKRLQSSFMRHEVKMSEEYSLCIDQLMLKYKKINANPTADEFIQFCKTKITKEVCQKIYKNTVTQSSSSLWKNLRFGRVTASKLYEVANCKTADGTISELVLGASIKSTSAMKRGILLEDKIFNILKSQHPDIKKAGLVLDSEYPLFGASSDGVSATHVFEIKCPQKEKTVNNYIKNGKVGNRYMAQIQLQMLMEKRNFGFFVVADPDFETNAKITKVEVKLDRQLVLSYMKRCITFWKKNIFEKIN